MVLRDVGHVLYEIYTAYFPQEVNAVAGFNAGTPEEEVWKINEKIMFEFFRDYEICPNLLNKGVLFQIYIHTRNSQILAYSHAGYQVLQQVFKV